MIFPHNEVWIRKAFLRNSTHKASSPLGDNAQNEKLLERIRNSGLIRAGPIAAIAAGATLAALSFFNHSFILLAVTSVPLLAGLINFNFGQFSDYISGIQIGRAHV